MDEHDYISWARVFALLIGMLWAAWMDLKYRRVPNQFWVTWASPAIFLWTLDLLFIQQQVITWYILATASGVVAYASMAVLGRPSLKDIKSGSMIDIVVAFWYLISVSGVIYGFYLHSNVDFVALVTGDLDQTAQLWWTTLMAALPIFLFDLGWRLRLIHGGADSKALMWVTLMAPSWGALPVIFTGSLDKAILTLPPSLALLIWSGFAFLVLPFIMLFRNLTRDGFGPLRLMWHAEQMDLDDVKNRHVWLLSQVIDMPSGERQIYHRTRAPSRTPTEEELDLQLAELQSEGLSQVWVTRKYPLLVFLCIGLIPLILLGGPMALLLPFLGM